MKTNPFTLTFGKEPDCSVSRAVQADEIIADFSSERPESQVYILTGVRGQGKTVLLTMITKQFEREKDWITVNLNPERDLLQALAANLYEYPVLKKAFINARLNLSAFGIGLSLEGEPPVSDIEIALRKMLDIVKQQGKRVFIAIDEVTNSQYMRIFSGTFQTLVRFDYPVFLLMTGLFENIRSLQNEKSLTFLYRAPRIELKPLGIKAMANLYEKILEIDETEATQLAVFTRGYSFAFQVVGYYIYKKHCSLNDLLPEFDEQMEEKVYEKIWTGLSEGDREVVRALAIHGKMRTREVIEATQNTSASFSTYRKRLSDKGLIDTKEYGYLELSLPRYAEFVKNYEMI